MADALRDAQLGDHTGRVAQVATLLMAGVDFPAEEDAVRVAVEQRGWAQSVHVGNDTFAVLRAGTERGWGVAVTCGAGINCVGVAPDGRHARFPALGAITGDWGGGYDLGLAAVSAAARSEDGRGPRTSLEGAVPAHFGVTTPSELAEEIRFHKYVQWLFFTQWAAVRRAADARGIEIMGDVPIYVAWDSADVWANRHLFQLDENGVPSVVAGVPAGALVVTDGQLRLTPNAKVDIRGGPTTETAGGGGGTAEGVK